MRRFARARALAFCDVVGSLSCRFASAWPTASRSRPPSGRGRCANSATTVARSPGEGTRRRPRAGSRAARGVTAGPRRAGTSARARGRRRRRERLLAPAQPRRLRGRRNRCSRVVARCSTTTTCPGSDRSSRTPSRRRIRRGATSRSTSARATSSARGASPPSSMPNHFDLDPPPGDRTAMRQAIGVRPSATLVVHPVRAIPRKDVGAALRLAERLGAVYWLVGGAEDGFGPDLGRILGNARTGVRQGVPEGYTIADVYAASDVVVLSSTWEGFGNAAIESVAYRRPLARRAVPGDARRSSGAGCGYFDLDAIEATREVRRAARHRAARRERRSGAARPTTSRCSLGDSRPCSPTCSRHPHADDTGARCEVGRYTLVAW